MPWDGAIRTRPKLRRWFRASEVAKVVGVSTATVIAWAKAGKLSHELTPSGRYRFAASDVTRWMSRRASVDA